MDYIKDFKLNASEQRLLKTLLDDILREPHRRTSELILERDWGKFVHLLARLKGDIP